MKIITNMEKEENEKIERIIDAYPGDEITINEEIKCKSYGKLKITYEFIPENINVSVRN